MKMRPSRRDLISGAAATGFSCWADNAIAQSKRNFDEVLRYVDPELRPAAKDILKASEGQPPFSMAQLADSRGGDTEVKALASPPWQRQTIPGAAGSPDVTVYVINAQQGGARPAILHIHGGGFMLGSARDKVPQLQQLSAALNCVVVSVEYRLAPETPYPGALNDSYAALLWLHSHALDLGVDRGRIAVLGESAGGGLAALLSLMTRDRGGPHLILQALVYPMLDERTGTTVHPRSPMGVLAWPADINSLGWRAFLGKAPVEKDVLARAVPARQGDLAGLPATFIGVGSIDLLVDEDVTFARRLIDANVATELVVVPGAFHAFDIVAPESGPAKMFTNLKLNAFKRAFGQL